MTDEEYYAGVAELEKEMKTKLLCLNLKCARENIICNKGDIFKSRKGIVEIINVKNIYLNKNNVPRYSYKAYKLKKNLERDKSEEIITVYDLKPLEDLK